MKWMRGKWGLGLVLWAGAAHADKSCPQRFPMSDAEIREAALEAAQGFDDFFHSLHTQGLSHYARFLELSLVSELPTLIAGETQEIFQQNFDMLAQGLERQSIETHSGKLQDEKRNYSSYLSQAKLLEHSLDADGKGLGAASIPLVNAFLSIVMPQFSSLKTSADAPNATAGQIVLGESLGLLAYFKNFLMNWTGTTEFDHLPKYTEALKLRGLSFTSTEPTSKESLIKSQRDVYVSLVDCFFSMFPLQYFLPHSWNPPIHAFRDGVPLKSRLSLERLQAIRKLKAQIEISPQMNEKISVLTSIWAAKNINKGQEDITIRSRSKTSRPVFMSRIQASRVDNLLNRVRGFLRAKVALDYISQKNKIRGNRSLIVDDADLEGLGEFFVTGAPQDWLEKDSVDPSFEDPKSELIDLFTPTFQERLTQQQILTEQGLWKETLEVYKNSAP